MKKLVVFSGVPGSGKSTLSKKYADAVDAIWLSVDPIEGAMKLSGVENNHQLGVAAYEVLKVLADQNLALDRIVVIDAVNPVEQVREMWRALAKQHKIPLDIVECVIDNQELHKKRIEKRIRKIPGMREITWDRAMSRKAEYQPWQDERIIINTHQSIEQSYAELLSQLKEKRD